LTAYRQQILPILTAFGLLIGALLAAASAGCNGGRGAGAACDAHSQCADAYQCLEDICVPRCDSNSECGDGYQCSSKGICELVISAIGDPCASEWECGLGQGCVLDALLQDSGQVLAATCQLQGTGGNVGALCEVDEDCHNSLCTLGHCSQVCAVNEDCPLGNRCALIPRFTLAEPALFYGCLQSTGVLEHRIPMTEPVETLPVFVPSDTHSLAIVSSVDDDLHLVGATRVVDPNGKLLFNGDSSPEQLVANRIRYIRQKRISTMLIPNSDNPEVKLQTGIYQVRMEAALPPFGEGNAIPEVSVFYKMDTGRVLDLHFYFLDLSDHPCNDEFGVDTLNASSAALSTGFQNEYLAELQDIFAEANINTGTIRYSDIDRADLDGIVDNDLADLLPLATNDTGLAIFFVRSLSPDGVQALIGGVPGPPQPGTSASGVAISADTLCYRDWTKLARVTAHSMASQMGLWNNRDPEGIPDPISDTDGDTDNLMFFGEFGGTTLSAGQKDVLGRFPGLR
jgi:hypothetical protein